MVAFCEKFDFWFPFGICWAPQLHQKSPKWRKKDTSFYKMRAPCCVPGADWKQLAPQKAPRGDQGIIFDASQRISSQFFIDFGPHCSCILETFGIEVCRSLNGEQPQRTIKNCREPSELSTAKLHCRNLAFCKMPVTTTNACPKTPSSKMGGGGARAAWRIRIRRHLRSGVLNP